MLGLNAHLDLTHEEGWLAVSPGQGAPLTQIHECARCSRLSDARYLRPAQEPA